MRLARDSLECDVGRKAAAPARITDEDSITSNSGGTTTILVREEGHHFGNVRGGFKDSFQRGRRDSGKRKSRRRESTREVLTAHLPGRKLRAPV